MVPTREISSGYEIFQAGRGRIDSCRLVRNGLVDEDED